MALDTVTLLSAPLLKDSNFTDLHVFISFQNPHNRLDSICLQLNMAFEHIPACLNSGFGN